MGHLRRGSASSSAREASLTSPRRCECGAAVPQLFHYAATVVVPDSEFVTFELTNGIKLPWLQYFSWLVTVPLLLMFLVSLTAHGGRSATVTLTLTLTLPASH